MKTLLRVLLVVTLTFLGFYVGPAACGSSGPNGGGPGDGGGDDGATNCYSCPTGDGNTPPPNFGGNGDGSTPGVKIYPHSNCPGTQTTISGKVYDPAGKNPIYNVTVYVPGLQPLPALPEGISCNSCADLYATPKASAVTDADGNFKIVPVMSSTGMALPVPDGSQIPLVVQVGKWQKQYTLANVTACQDNPQPDGSLRLPKNHNEGSLPNIAISTGAADSLECLLLRIGVDPGEFTGGAGGAGRIHIFTGQGGATTNGGGSPDPGMALWNSDPDINKFDVVLLSCEGAETMHMNQQVLLDYANGGGRVFASHFHYAWFDTGPFAAISPSLATWTTSVQDIGNISTNIVTTLPNGMPFPEGVALGKWLGNVGALNSTGELPIIYACHNADVSATNMYAQPWVSADKASPAANATEYFSFDLPVGSSAEGKCGRVVYSDMHVSGGAGASRGTLPADYANTLQIVPDQCATGDLSPQEKALEFMVFDLSSCLIPPGITPMAPPPQ